MREREGKGLGAGVGSLSGGQVIFLRHLTKGSPSELPLGSPLCTPGPLTPGAPSTHGDACGFGLQRELRSLHHIVISQTDEIAVIG